MHVKCVEINYVNIHISLYVKTLSELLMK